MRAVEKVSVDASTAKKIDQALEEDNLEQLILAVWKDKVLLNGIKKLLLKEVNAQCQLLCSKTVPFQSVLTKYRNINQLGECTGLMQSVIMEMAQRL